MHIIRTSTPYLKNIRTKRSTTLYLTRELVRSMFVTVLIYSAFRNIRIDKTHYTSRNTICLESQVETFGCYNEEKGLNRKTREDKGRHPGPHHHHPPLSGHPPLRRTFLTQTNANQINSIQTQNTIRRVISRDTQHLC